MNLRFFFILGQGPDSSCEHMALRKEFGYDFLMLDTVLHTGGSRPPRIGSFPPPFRRFCISARRKAECRPHGRFVLAYQCTQGVRKLPRKQSIETEHAWINTSLNRTAQADRNRILQKPTLTVQCP